MGSGLVHLKVDNTCVGVIKAQRERKNLAGRGKSYEHERRAEGASIERLQVIPADG